MPSKSKILIIDDDRDMVEALKIILEKESYIVRVAFDGEQGLDTIRKEKPDLIILDLLLPGEDGITICQKLKTHSEYRDIPILVVTALAKKLENKILPEEESTFVKIEGHFDKPVNPQNLLNKVKQILRKDQGKIANEGFKHRQDR